MHKKMITVIIDGSADRGQEALEGMTPYEAANTPVMDSLFRRSMAAGTVVSIPEGLEIGSAVANLNFLGFDPYQYQGRAAVEAAGAGIKTNPDNLYIRTNFCTFEGEDYAHAKIKSYSAYDVASEKARPLNEMLQRELFSKYGMTLHYAGSFRNILEVPGGKKLYPVELAPAHDIIGQPISQYIYDDEKSKVFFELQEKCYELLKDSGCEVNGVWFWGASIPPVITGDTKGRKAFAETVLMQGITAIAGLELYSCPEEYRLPRLLTDKLEKALEAINGDYDNIYVHIQECDDLAHEREPMRKKVALELIDMMIGNLVNGIEGDFNMLLASDHYTYSDTGAHGGSPTPFFIYDSTNEVEREGAFTEQNCIDTGLVLTMPELHAMRK